jgi:hypothetical protein
MNELDHKFKPTEEDFIKFMELYYNNLKGIFKICKQIQITPLFY